VAASVSLAPKEADVVETENPIVEISSQVPSVVSYNLEPVGKKQYGTLFDTVVFDSNFLNNLGLNDEKISNLDLNMSEFLRKIT
jgi:hypothetical protein